MIHSVQETNRLMVYAFIFFTMLMHSAVSPWSLFRFMEIWTLYHKKQHISRTVQSFLYFKKQNDREKNYLQYSERKAEVSRFFKAQI